MPSPINIRINKEVFRKALGIKDPEPVDLTDFRQALKDEIIAAFPPQEKLVPETGPELIKKISSVDPKDQLSLNFIKDTEILRRQRNDTGYIRELSDVEVIGEPTDNQVLAWKTSKKKWVPITMSSSGSAGITIGVTTITGGNDKCILFDDNGLVGEDTDFIWNKSTNTLTLGGGGETLDVSSVTNATSIISTAKMYFDSGGGEYHFNGVIFGDVLNINASHFIVDLNGDSGTILFIDSGANYKVNTSGNFLINNGSGGIVDIGNGLKIGTLTGLLKATAGTVSVATSGTDYEVPLTFSTGLTRTTNTITANLSTGVSGGQSVIGGTAAGNNLTLTSTSNATKGKIIFGSASAYDQVNDRLGIGTTSPTSKLQVNGQVSFDSGQFTSNGGGNVSLVNLTASNTVQSTYFRLPQALDPTPPTILASPSGGHFALFQDLSGTGSDDQGYPSSDILGSTFPASAMRMGTSYGNYPLFDFEFATPQVVNDGFGGFVSVQEDFIVSIQPVISTADIFFQARPSSSPEQQNFCFESYLGPMYLGVSGGGLLNFWMNRSVVGYIDPGGDLVMNADISGGSFTSSGAFTGGSFSGNGSALTSLNASNITTGTLAVARGGTNISSYAVGDLLYASGATILSKLADIATGNALISGGVGVAPSWGKIGLTTHISGVLGPANGGTGVANNAASTLTISGNFATTLTVTAGTGVTLPTTGTLATRAGTETFTNKDLTSTTNTFATVTTISSSATPTPTGDSRQNELYVTAQAAAAAFAAPSGSATQGNLVVIRIKDNATARALSFNAIYRAGTSIALPTTTTISKTMYMLFRYNSNDTKWDLIALVDGI